eukprot:9504187-Pyramimonas_sp.AAC.3
MPQRGTHPQPRHNGGRGRWPACIFHDGRKFFWGAAEWRKPLQEHSTCASQTCGMDAMLVGSKGRCASRAHRKDAIALGAFRSCLTEAGIQRIMCGGVAWRGRPISAKRDGRARKAVENIGEKAKRQ